MAARVTTASPWPDGSGKAPLGSAIVLTAEDGLADTIRTRADAARADVRRIYCLNAVHDENGKPSSFSLQDDLVLLAEKVREIGDVVLIIIDPITAYLGAGRIDTHRTADVRAVLSRLKDFAEQHNITVLGLTHPAKTVTKAMNAATGSQAFIAAARSAYLFTREMNEGQETGRTLMLPIKNNLAPRKPAAKPKPCPALLACYARKPSSCVTSCSLSWIASNLHRNILITRGWSCSCHFAARRPRSRSNSLSAPAIRRSQSAMEFRIDPSVIDIAAAPP